MLASISKFKIYRNGVETHRNGNTIIREFQFGKCNSIQSNPWFFVVGKCIQYNVRQNVYLQCSKCTPSQSHTCYNVEMQTIDFCVNVCAIVAFTFTTGGLVYISINSIIFRLTLSTFSKCSNNIFFIYCNWWNWILASKSYI